MKFNDLLATVGDLPSFTTQYLATGQDLSKVRLQLNRWTKSGKLIRLNKSLYCLGEAYRKSSIHPFLLAAQLKTPSYISLQSALAWHSMIPEFVPITTSVTTARPQHLSTPLGNFDFRHINKKYFWGYKQEQVSSNQFAFIARPEKALLDLLHLTPNGNDADYIKELRLQNLEAINFEFLNFCIEKLDRPKFKDIATVLSTLQQEPSIEI